MNKNFKPSELEQHWNLGSRRVRQLLEELQRLGFSLSSDLHGARLCPAALADAVKNARQARQPLSSLLECEDLQPYRAAKEASVAPEDNAIATRQSEALLQEMIALRTEQAILAGVMRALYGALRKDMFPQSTAEVDWRALGLPDPREL